MRAIHRTAAILSIGDELTLGQNLDTNSQWLAQRLVAMGVIPIEHATVADDMPSTRDAIVRLAAAADVVIATGGLGPTADDLTRNALAAAMDQPLAEDAEALEHLRSLYSGREMPTINRVQAMRPMGGRILANPVGSAPGLHGAVRAGDPAVGREVDVFCLPGPPREMRPMFEASVAPALRPDPEQVVRVRALHTVGLGESDVATRLGNLMSRSCNPLIGTTASKAVVSCRIRYTGPGPAAAAQEAVAAAETAVRERVGPYVFGADDETLAGAVLGLLIGRGKRLATVESCTGGLLGALLTEVPGSSAAYAGGWVTYTNELKQSLVGVPAELFGPGRPGAVSREVAGAMARGGLERSGADYCLSITGIAGPEGGSAEKPVGTVWIALAGPGGEVECRRFAFLGERANVRDWSSRSALGMLRFELVGARGLRMLRQVE